MSRAPRGHDRRGVLDANLKKLLTRSWVPARPEPDFRNELKRRVLARAAESAIVRPDADLPRVRRPSWMLPALAAAATLLGAVAVWFVLHPGAGVDLHDPSALLASGRTALRTTADGAFVAAEAPRSALAPGGFLEIFTPVGVEHAVDVTPDGVVTAHGDSHVTFACTSGDVTLTASVIGEVRFERGTEPHGAWRIDTPGGAFTLTKGAITIRRDGVTRDDLVANDGAGAAAKRELVTTSEPEPPATASSPADASDSFRIEGRVFDATNTLPVTDFVVHLVPLEMENENGHVEMAFGRMPEHQAVESADGTFTIEPPNPGTWRLFIEADGFAIWHSRPLKVHRGERIEPIEAALALGATVRGRVVDAVSGEPIEDAYVFSETDHAQLLAPLDPDFLRGMTGAEPPRHARTDARGEFTIEDLSPYSSSSDPQRLRAVARDHLPSVVVVDGLVSNEVRLDVTFRLGAGGGIEGTVVHPDGTPWKRSLLMAMPTDVAADPGAWSLSAGAAVTDVDGHYRMENLPAGVYVVVHLGDQPRVGSDGALQAIPTAVPVVGLVTVDFRLDHSGVTLTGTLTDVSGQPLAETSLSFAMRGKIADRGRAGWQGGTTDEKGVFRVVNLEGGTCEAYLVRGAGAAVIWLCDFELPASGEARHDLVLRKESIAGEAVEGTSGEPVANAVVVLVSLDGIGAENGFEARVLTAANGAFEFAPVAPGRHQIRVLPQRGNLAAQSSDPLTVTEGKRVDGVRIAMFPAGAITATVVDASGAPVAGAQLTVVDGAGTALTLASDGVTDKNGAATLYGVLPGPWTVVATATGHASKSAAVNVAADQFTAVTIQLDER